MSKVLRPITAKESQMICALEGVRFFPGSSAKRFVRRMAVATEITDAQGDLLRRIVYQFRRQIAPDVVVLAVETTIPTARHPTSDDHA